MNGSVGIATGVGIAIIVGIIAFQINETSWEKVTVDEYYEKGGRVSSVVYPDNPQLLGPLQINKDKYLLGEHVYVILKDIRPQDQGTIDFFTPEGKLYETLGFNGQVNDYYKKYFKPQLLKSKDLCEKEQLIGTWKVGFRGYMATTINFEILPEILPNQEYQFEECSVAYEVDPTKPGTVPTQSDE